nr:hypothetical protein GCM10025732_25310 [Glycomyces mayteni]
MDVVLAEDHSLLRDGLTRMLEAHDFTVVEAVDNGPALTAALLKHRPDVAVVDIRLPRPSRTRACAPPSRPAATSPRSRSSSSPSTWSSSTPANSSATAAAASATC